MNSVSLEIVIKFVTMWNHLIFFFFAILTLISAVWCEIVAFEKCGLQNGRCEINEVSINPCAEAAEGHPCKIKRGKVGAMTIDFTPQFTSNSLFAKCTWPNGVLELPLPNMETDACKTTTCPTVPGTRQQYTFDLKVSRAFPSGVFPVKWVFFGENDEDECCFLIKIQLK